MGRVSGYGRGRRLGGLTSEGQFEFESSSSRRGLCRYRSHGVKLNSVLSEARIRVGQSCSVARWAIETEELKGSSGRRSSQVRTP